MKCFAHTKEDLQKGVVFVKSEGQPLLDHLNAVAILAEEKPNLTR